MTQRGLWAGAAVLFVAMGVGRFAYTPLLALMRVDAGLTVAMAGVLASSNLAGYLAGAALTMHPGVRRRRAVLTAWAAVTVVLTTAAMALPPVWWMAARFATGVASGICFVLVVSLILDRLAKDALRFGIALVFAGIGSGIAGSGALVMLFAAYGGSRAAWLGLAAVSAVLVLVALPALPRDIPVTDSQPGRAGADARGPVFLWLAFAYGIEGAAYIIPGTFLVALVKEIPGLASYAAGAWILVGIVAIPSALMWNAAARRWSTRAAFLAALVLQTVGLVAPILLPGWTGVLILAVTLGGTFIGIGQLASAFGRELRPHRSNVALGQLTVLYGIGQVAGPLIATRISLATGSYRGALVFAAGALGVAIAGFGGYLAVARRDRAEARREERA